MTTTIQMRAQAITALLGILLIAPAIAAQTAVQTSDPNALALVQKVIAATGGGGWTAVGAAVTQVTFTYPTGNIKPLVSKRSDDWSTAAVNERDEPVIASAGSTGTPAPGPVAATSGGARIRKSASGKFTIAARGFDLSDIAVAYPAVALRLASQRAGCSTKVLSTPAAGTTGIRQECHVKGIPAVSEQLTWTIDSTGLPKKLEFPVLTADGKMLIYETAEFKQFQQVQGMSVPATVDIRYGNTPLYTITFAAPTFSSNLPQSLFALR